MTLLVFLVGLLTVSALTIGFNLLLRSNLRSDADRVLQARAAAALQGVEVSGGRVTAEEAPDEAAPDSGVWVFDGTRVVERPQAPASVDELAASLARSGGGYAESEPEDLRLLAVPVSDGGPRAGTVIAALSIEPYERSANRALIASVVLAGLMLGLLVGLTRIALNRALEPVAKLTAEAAERSEHDVEHRFNLGPPHDELTQLAATFDSMLTRLAANLRHERMLTAEISHELRTPLAAISAEAELALSRTREGGEYREALATISRRSGQLADILETLLLTARGSGSIGGEATDANELAEAAASDLLAESTEGVNLGVHPSNLPLVADVSLSTGVRILAPLLENALRYGHGSIEVGVERADEYVLISVTDDGPGITSAESEQIFEPGTRGAAAAAGGGAGSGLGLALARRLARLVGGDVFAVGGTGHGLVCLRLPLVPDP